MELGFLSVQKAREAVVRRPGPSFSGMVFLFRCGEAPIWSYHFLSVQRRQPQAEGQVRPSVAWCFGVAKPTFWRLEGSNLELATCWFRKRR